MATGITSIFSPFIVWGPSAGCNVRLWWRGAMLLLALAVSAGADDPAWAALLTEVREMAGKGEYQQALPRAQMALKEAERFGPGDTRVALVLNDLGLIEFELARYASADRAFRRGIAILDRTREAPVALAKLCSSLASLLTDLNLQPGYAEKLRRRALQIAVQELGPAHPEIPTLLGNLGTTLMARRNYREARELFEKARGMLSEAGGEKLTRASLTSNLGVVASLTGRQVEAAGHFREAIAIWDELAGPVHPDLVRPCLNLGRVYLQLGKPELAWEMMERARAAAERSLPENHPTLMEVLRAGAAAAKKSGRKGEASALDRRLRSITPADASPIGVHVDISDLRPEGH